MNTRRKVASLALGVCLALSVCACGGPAEQPSVGEQEEPSTADVSVETHEAHYRTRITKQPTCYAPGESVKSCTVCYRKGLSEHPDKKAKVEPSKGHAFTLQQVEKNKREASCTEPELCDYDYICPDCGELLAVEHDIQLSPAKGHAWSLDEEGYATCSTCGLRVPSGARDENVVHQHAFGFDSVVSEATCLEPGLTLEVCLGCGARQYRVTMPKGHSWNVDKCNGCGLKPDETATPSTHVVGEDV